MPSQRLFKSDLLHVVPSHSVRVNLALAYTELTEELCRLRKLSSLQSQILRTLLQEQAINGGECSLHCKGMGCHLGCIVRRGVQRLGGLTSNRSQRAPKGAWHLSPRPEGPELTV